MAYFLSIDSKKGSSDIQLRKPLTKYIEDQGCKIDDFQEALNELEKLRENIRQATDKKEGVLAVYYRYFSILNSIAKRVPINEQEVRVQYNWYDIYKQKKIGRYSVYYEKACVLFNIAAVHSQLATLENMESADGIKNACKLFRVAAGTFEQVKKLLESHPQDAAGEDLSGDSLTLFSTIMIAQAQELFFLMATKSNMKSAAMAKLAAQAADFYDSAFELMQGANLKSILPKRWPVYVEMKRDSMKGCAHFQLGRHCASERTYGEEVARYRVSYKYFTHASKYKSQIPEITQWFDQNFNALQSALSAAEKDNNTIYHETVLPEHKLKALEKKVMVQPEYIPEDKLKLAPSTDPFAKLIPLRVRKADSVFSERKAELLRNLSAELDKNNSNTKKALNSMGLPGAIEALETPHGIPLSLLQKMQHVKKEGGSAFLNEQLESLHHLAAENSAFLDSAVQCLDDEENDDSQMRAQYGMDWTRTPSHTLNSVFRQEANKWKTNLEHAIKSDGFIKTSLIEWQREIDLLTQDQGQVLALLPEASKQDVSVVSLKALLKELDDTLLQSENALTQLKEAINKVDILEALIKSQESEQEMVFVNALAQFDGLVTMIKKSAAVDDLLAKIQEENNLFNQKKSSNAQLIQRQQVLQNFEIAYQNYLQLKDYLGQGHQFYISLQETLQQFKSKCSDFAFARKTEKQDLIVTIQTRQTSQVQQSQIGMTPFPVQFGRGTTQPVYVTQVPQMGRGTPMIVQPQMMQQGQIRQTPTNQHFYVQPQQQFQPQMQQQMQPQVQPQVQYMQQPQFQSPPPSYTQSQAQRSVFPQDPYGNLGPSPGY